MNLKFLCLFLVLFLLPSSIISQVVNLDCDFRISGSNYECYLNEISIPDDESININFRGAHQPGHNNQNVTRLFFHFSIVPFVVRDAFKTFPGLRSYIVMNSNPNSFTRIQSNALQDAHNLQEFVVSNSNLQTISTTAFQGTPNLRDLILTRNQLTSVPAGLLNGLTNLEMIMLNVNRLTSLPQNFFQPAVSLTHIHLGSNLLTQLPGTLLAANTRVIEFHATENQINSIGRGFLNNLDTLHTLALLGNVCVSMNFNGIGTIIPIENVHQQLETCYANYGFGA